MRATYVDAEGNVCCPVCGAKNSFTVKRTTKAKWTAMLTIGVGALAMPKRLNCNGCGTNLTRGGAIAPPGSRPRPAETVPSSPEATPTPVAPRTSKTSVSERIQDYYGWAQPREARRLD